MKCRRGYQNHRASDCPFDFPDPRNYKELTKDILLSQKRGGAGNGKPVGAVTSSSHIVEVDDDVPSHVGAVMPSAVLGAGSESEEDVSAPLTVQHLLWVCALLGPAVDNPTIVKSMLDCGAHVVLIDAALVKSLGLRRFCLHKPLPISVALNNSTSSDSHLYEYVKITPFAPDSSYVSRTIKAIVTPSLCVPLLLGLPFLVTNNIVADFAARTAIDKDRNFDLLNPPLRVLHKTFMEPVVSMAEVKRNKSTMLDELKVVCEECLRSGKCTPEFVKPLDIAAMVRDRIEVLAMHEKFGHLKQNFLSEFKDVFEPLPHVDKLPRNITARIKLKDADQTIKTRVCMSTKIPRGVANFNTATFGYWAYPPFFIAACVSCIYYPKI
jgi:hypothetical protein